MPFYLPEGVNLENLTFDATIEAAKRFYAEATTQAIAFYNNINWTAFSYVRPTSADAVRLYNENMPKVKLAVRNGIYLAAKSFLGETNLNTVLNFALKCTFVSASLDSWASVIWIRSAIASLMIDPPTELHSEPKNIGVDLNAAVTGTFEQVTTKIYQIKTDLTTAVARANWIAGFGRAAESIANAFIPGRSLTPPAEDQAPVVNPTPAIKEQTLLEAIADCANDARGILTGFIQSRSKPEQAAIAVATGAAATYIASQAARKLFRG